MINKKVILGMCLMAVAGTASAQSQDVLPNKVYKGPVGVAESTYSFVPQIVNVTGQQRPEVSNIFRKDFRTVDPPNNLKLGGIDLKSKTVPQIGQYWPSINATGWTPPDPDIGVGPNHVVTVVNSSIAIHTKAGTAQFQQTLQSFFSSVGASSFVFDPKAFYDKTSGRFFVVALDKDDAANESYFDIAVSDDSDPNGTWYKYRIINSQTVGSTKFWLDYPGWGSNKDVIVATGNMFGFTNGFNGAQVFVFRKSDFLTGAAPQITKFDLTNRGSIQVARSSDASHDKVYMSSVGGTSSMRIYAISNVLTSPAIAQTTVTVPTFTNPSDYASGPGGAIHDPLDGRLMTVYYRAGRLYLSHTVKNGTDNASRWYEINTNNYPASAPTYRQGGTISGATGTSIWMPAIAANAEGSIAVVSSRSSSTQAAQIVANSRNTSDALGNMGPVVVLRNSEGNSYSSGSRWGDYFGATVDPVDELTFWGIAMVYNSSGGWRTYVESFTVASPLGLSSLNLEYPAVEGGTGLYGTVVLNQNAAVATNVSLSDNSANVTVPATVTVPAGASTASFSITTTGVSSTLNTVITATLNGGNRTAQLQLTPIATPSALTLNPTSVGGGSSSTATVTLNQAANGPGATCTITDNGPELSAPATVSVPSGSTSATFMVSTTDVSASINRTVTVTRNGVSQTATLTITAIQIINCIITPANVVGGNQSVETVYLNGPAPANFVLTVRDNDSRTSVPATVTVPEGATQVVFPITSQGTAVQFTSEIRVSRGRQMFRRYLVVYAPALNTFSISPTVVKGGETAVGTITMNGKAFAAGVYMSVSSDGPEATVPGTVGFPQNIQERQFNIQTIAVSARVIRTITVTYNGVTRTKTLTINK